MKICLWGNIARTLKGNSDGGGELQIALLAKALARGGHEVVIIDYQSPENIITEEGIKVLKIDGWDDGIPAIRYVTHRLPKLYRSLRDQKADIYYCRIREFRHIITFWAARTVKAKFVLGMASDLDVMGFRMRLSNYYIPNFSLKNSVWWLTNGIINEIVFPWLLRKSDAVLVQHQGQKQILENKGIKSVIFPNLIDLSQIPEYTNNRNGDFIYVGSLDKRKGFAEFFKIVEKTPAHSFKVVGQPRDKVAARYFEQLKSFGNVKLYGHLSHSETKYQISISKALISTSWIEGFPNVFIEAWACGIPVLSLFVDPGSVIEAKNLGKVAHGNIEKLIEAMDNLKNTDGFSQQAKSYVEATHSMSVARIEIINNLFREIYEK